MNYWDELLPYCAWPYCSSVYGSAGYTPNVFGQQGACMPIDVMILHPEDGEIEEV